MLITASEFFQSTISESFLIVQNKLFSVVLAQRYKLNIHNSDPACIYNVAT
jgi:hypothetical protein